jgi:hypothetical protein
MDELPAYQQGAETSRGIQSINMGTRIQEWKYYAPSRGIRREERMGIPTLRSGNTTHLVGESEEKKRWGFPH